MARIIEEKLINFIPFKAKLFPSLSFETDEKLGLNYHFIAFKKISEDNRNWDWNKVF